MKTYMISTGRSGTNFLNNVFSKYYPEVNLEHQRKWSRVINVISNSPLPKIFRLNLYRIIFIFLRDEEIPDSSCDPLLSLALVDYLKKIAYDDFKVILLVRNPYDFVESFMNWKERGIRKKVLHNLIPFWQPVGYLHGMSVFQWAKMRKFEKFAWVWNYKNKKFFDFLKNRNGMIVKLEEVKDDPRKLDEIVKFIGMNPRSEYQSNRIDKNESEKIYFKNTFQTRKRIDALTSEMQGKLNY